MTSNFNYIDLFLRPLLFEKTTTLSTETFLQPWITETQQALFRMQQHCTLSNLPNLPVVTRPKEIPSSAYPLCDAAQDAFHILVGWQFSLRTKRDAFTQEQRDILERATSFTTTHKTWLWPLAETAVDLHAWIEDAWSFLRQRKNTPTQTAPDLASTLLRTLDQIQLFQAAVLDHDPFTDLSFESELQDSLAWCSDHSEALLDAQSWFLTLLSLTHFESAEDHTLELSLFKFLPLLDTLEEVISRQEHSVLPPLSDPATNKQRVAEVLDKQLVAEALEATLPNQTVKESAILFANKQRVAEVLEATPSPVLPSLSDLAPNNRVSGDPLLWIPKDLLQQLQQQHPNSFGASVALPTYQPTATGSRHQYQESQNEPIPEGIRLLWHAPDHRWRAFLTLPSATQATDLFCVRLYLTSGVHVLGVFLYGIYKPIQFDNSGTPFAPFTIQELRERWGNPSYPSLLLQMNDGSFRIGIPQFPTPSTS